MGRPPVAPTSRWGVTGGGDAQSAGIFQKIQDSHGDPIGAISVDIAADTSRSDFGNSSAGLFALFVGDMLADPPDFVLADSHDFGKVLPDSPEYATLSTGQISASEATILIQITRAFAVPTELDLYIDNVVQDQNVDPVVGAITAPVDPVQLGTVVFASASFTDANPQDTLTGVFDWGDGTSSAATVTGPNGSGSASGSHTYSQAGVYTVTLTITDSSDGGDSSIFEFVVVFDPNDGFVTGGGWIDSAAGAYVPEPSLVGRANFGFVSKYKQGANTPTGKTQFRFKVANLDFHSDVYDWLLVAGAKAQFKGTGSINNAGNYGFILTAVDGKINGGNGTDKFRIKIWDKSNGDSVVYDNQAESNDDDTLTTVIAGGSIAIHKN